MERIEVFLVAGVVFCRTAFVSFRIVKYIIGDFCLNDVLVRHLQVHVDIHEDLIIEALNEVFLVAGHELLTNALRTDVHHQKLAVLLATLHGMAVIDDFHVVEIIVVEELWVIGLA